MLNRVSELLQLKRNRFAASTGSTDLVSDGPVIMEALKANCIDALTLCMCLVPRIADDWTLV